MTLFDELYFDITLSGEKTEIRKLVSYLRSGELDEFFEIEPDYIDLGDEYDDAEDGDTVTVIFTNDDMGIEIDEFDTDEFLDVFCRAARRLDARGVLYDCDDGEYHPAVPAAWRMGGGLGDGPRLPGGGGRLVMLFLLIHGHGR